MNRRLTQICLAAAAGWALLAAAPVQAVVEITGGSGPRVNGSGVVAEEVRAITGFSSLAVNSAVDVRLKAGTAERVTVRADDNIVPLIDTRVDNGRLIVGVQPGVSYRTRHAPVVTVEFVQMNGVQILGSGDVRADVIKAQVFEVSVRGSGDVFVERIDSNVLAVSITGSGDVTARGRADSVAVHVDGSGDARLDGVEARQAAVRIRGSGDVRVHAVESLRVDIAGSGDVRYRGTPQLMKKVAGSGDVLPLR
jgi:hypothetical protein